jgi:predicted phosphodiesterase
MRTLIVGDIHGCAGELAALIRDAAADRVVLVGDLYTKGPDPVGVWQLIQEHRAEAVLGNHDLRLRDVISGARPRDTEGRACVAALDATGSAWREHLAALPLFLEGVAGFTVVHAGLHPSGDLSRTSESMAVSMRRFPGTSEEDPWWVSAYRGARPVVYGHDARRGLVRVERSGRPWVIGLDSGCVYGGRLTGWIPEEDRLLQVAARKVWRPIGKEG